MKITIELEAKEFAELTAATESPAKSSDITQKVEDQLKLLVSASERHRNFPDLLVPLTEAMVDLIRLKKLRKRR